MSGGRLLLIASTLCVVTGTWLIGELAPRISRRRTLNTNDLMVLAGMKHGLQRRAVKWLTVMVASVVGAYKLKDVMNLIIAAVR